MDLLDPHKRKIDYLRISVTDRCNLRCIYCIPKGTSLCRKNSDVLGRDLILSFVRSALKHGVKKVRLTGGEPLLRPDIAPLVRGLKALGVQDVSLTTNGILLEKKLPALKKAGLDRVNLSLDTMRPERFRILTRGGAIGKPFRALELLEEAGLTPVKINVVPIRGINDDEIPSFAELTRTRPFHIRFIELMPIGNRAWSRERLIKSSEAMSIISSALGPLEWKGQEGSSRNYALNGARGLIGFISPESDHFCGSCNRLRITAKGKLRPCLFSPFEIDITKARSEEELEKMLLQAVREKPAGRAADAPLPLASMSQIGG